MEKPSYRTSKNALWLSIWAAWATILMLAVGAVMGSEQAVAFGSIAVPSMSIMIPAMLGVHRGFGSMDMRTSMDLRPIPRGGLDGGVM